MRRGKKITQNSVKSGPFFLSPFKDHVVRRRKATLCSVTKEWNTLPLEPEPPARFPGFQASGPTSRLPSLNRGTKLFVPHTLKRYPSPANKQVILGPRPVLARGSGLCRRGQMRGKGFGSACGGHGCRCHPQNSHRNELIPPLKPFRAPKFKSGQVVGFQAFAL